MRVRSIPSMTGKQIIRFWSHIAKGDADQCWEWQTYVSPNGYGQVGIGPDLYPVHRVAYFLHHGSIRDDLLVCHTCDNRKCCNPAHLFLGNHKDNWQDAQNKGRNQHPPKNRGVKHPNSRVTLEQVAEIRRRHANGERGVDLAREFGMSRTGIMYIYKGKNYKPEEAP